MKTSTKGKEETSAFCTVLTHSAGPVVLVRQLCVGTASMWVRSGSHLVLCLAVQQWSVFGRLSSQRAAALR
jgi:hypothetical protein